MQLLCLAASLVCAWNSFYLNMTKWNVQHLFKVKEKHLLFSPTLFLSPTCPPSLHPSAYDLCSQSRSELSEAIRFLLPWRLFTGETERNSPLTMQSESSCSVLQHSPHFYLSLLQFLWQEERHQGKRERMMDILLQTTHGKREKRGWRTEREPFTPWNLWWAQNYVSLLSWSQ